MSNEIAPAELFSPADVQKALEDAGAIDQAAESWNRMKLDGPNFVTDGEDAWQTPIRGGGPAFLARLITNPEQYQAKYFNEADADKAGRPDMANRFCKSRFDYPGENREFGTNGASCRECVFNPFESKENFKCGWKGDLRMQVFPDGDEPELTGQETEYVLTMSVTGMIEWRGTRRSPTAGSVTDKNFMVKLAEFSVERGQDIWGIDTATKSGGRQAIVRGMLALEEGRVAVEARSLKAVDEQRGREWYVPSFTPIHIVPEEDAPAQVEAGD